MRFFLRTLAPLGLCLVWSCSGPSTAASTQKRGTQGVLTRPEALALLAKTPDFTQPQIIQVFEGTECIVMEPGATGAPRYGELTILGANNIATYRTLKSPKEWPSDVAYFRDMQRCPPVLGRLVKVELTPEAKKVADKWKRGDAYAIPVQSRVLVEVTGISSTSPSEARVEFTWQYKDLTTFAPPSPYAYGASPGVATFRLYDDGWRWLRSQM